MTFLYLIKQRKEGYPTGCEIVSLAMMIDYEKDINLKSLVSEMPRSNDPTKGFRGKPSTSAGFTILPSALVDLTEKYAVTSYNMSGLNVEDLKKQLNLNIPIVVWVNGLGFNVHAICLTGYKKEGFYYNDPWKGTKNDFITYDSFYKIWSKSIYDKNYNISYPLKMALSYIKQYNKKLERRF